MPAYQTVDLAFGIDSGYCFKVVKSTPDGEGWVLHACKATGGVISRGAFGTDADGRNRKVDAVELHGNVAAKRFKFKTPLKVSDYLICESLKLKFMGTTTDECYVVGGREVQTSLTPLREHVPDVGNNAVTGALFWTMVEEAHEKIMKQWSGGQYVAAVDAMNTLCGEVCEAIGKLPTGVTGSNLYFSQSVHLMFEFMTSTARVLDVKPAWDVNRLRGPQWDDPAMPKARTRCKAAGKRVALVIDKRLNPKTRTRLYKTRRFDEYLPKMNAPQMAPKLVASVEEMGVCEDPQCTRAGKRQVIIASTRKCGACMQRLSAGVWDGDDNGDPSADGEVEDAAVPEDASEYSQLDIIFDHPPNAATTCYFRVAGRLPDEAGWELRAHTIDADGDPREGCTGRDRSGTAHALRTLEIEDARAKDRFGLDLWTGVCVMSDTLKVRYNGSLEHCWVVGGQNVREIKEPRRRRGPAGSSAATETASAVSHAVTEGKATAVPQATLAAEIGALPPSERLQWAEERLAPYHVDRTTFLSRERVIQEEIATFGAAGRRDEVELLQEALWVVRDYNNHPEAYANAPPPPAAAENVEDMLSGLGFAVTKGKGKKKKR